MTVSGIFTRLSRRRFTGASVLLALCSLTAGCTNNLSGYVDREGKLVIERKFHAAHKFKEGLACAVPVSWHGMWRYGFIDHEGKFVIPADFHQANDFSEGMAAVYAGGSVFGSNARWGYIDKSGKMVIEPKFWRAGPFTDGLAYVEIEPMLRKPDGTIVPVTEKNFKDMGNNIPVNRYGYIDKTGKWVIEPNLYCHMPFILSDRVQFSEGLAAFYKDNRVGFIDKKGRVAIKPLFQEALPFRNGLAAVSIGGEEFKTQFNTTMVMAGKWGMIDRSGKLAVPVVYDLHNEDDAPYILSKDDKLFLPKLNADGKVTLAPYTETIFSIPSGKFEGAIFNEQRDFSEGLAVIEPRNLEFKAVRARLKELENSQGKPLQ